MKIHVFAGATTDDDHATLYVDRVEGDAAFALAVIEAELTIEDGELILKFKARNTSNKPNVRFKLSRGEDLDQAETETA